MATALVNPFGDEALEEIVLHPAPLEKVLAQLRFPAVLSIGDEGYVRPFQEQLRRDYPILRIEQEVQALLTPQGVVGQKPRSVWRLHDVDNEWIVGLAPDFVSLETTAYTTRDEFVARLLAVFQALDTLASPGPVVVADRLGVRYINRLTGDDAGPGLRRLVREEVFGPLTIQMPSGSEFLASLSQAHFKLDGPQMQARWGRLPPGAIFLPGIDPFESTSWFLDIDVFFEGQQVFSPGPTADAARHAASHAYRFFRWAMSDEFIAQRRVS